MSGSSILPPEGVRYINQSTVFIDKDAITYKMTDNGKRRAVIFNHNYCNINRQLKDRAGTAYDMARLREELLKLRFEIKIYEDLQHIEILKTVDELCRISYENYDCLAVFVLTHGHRNKLMAADDEYDAEIIWNKFTADKCPSLAGKPKLFFINACRGDFFDYGHEFVYDDLQMDGAGTNPDIAYKLPNNTDFLIAFSTVDGYISHRKPTEGTWFIQSLCDVLSQEEYKGLEIKEILTAVSRKVALKCNEESISTTQVPTVTSTLIRNLYLR